MISPSKFANGKIRAAEQPIAIANWLLSVAFLVFLMVVVGGITRLTESGLSITEWKPITGALPPLNQADWQIAFEKYQQIPEYREINGPAGMTLAEFKNIFFWEWAHRLLGRVIGIAFALPLLYFAIKRAIPAGYSLRLVALLILGGLQGVIGWWMVVSGLSMRTDVSHFRLATHLLLALFILGSLVWTALDLKQWAKGYRQPARLTGLALITAIILFIQLLFGAYTAGLNAGTVSNSWPLMNGQFFPGGIRWAAGWWTALNNDPFLIHFIHRWWAWITVGFLVIVARRVKKIDRRASIALHAAFGTQILLGIATVISGINLELAALHQAVGATVVAATAWCLHILGRRQGR